MQLEESTDEWTHDPEPEVEPETSVSPAPTYEPSPVEASLDPWPSYAFADSPPAPVAETPPPVFAEPAAQTPVLEAPTAVAPIVPAEPAPVDAFSLEIEPTTISWPRPSSKQSKKKDSKKDKEPKRRWGQPVTTEWKSAPAPEIEDVPALAPTAAPEVQDAPWSAPADWAPPTIQTSAPTIESESSWAAAESDVQGFQYDTPTFAMSLPSANDTRLAPSIGKRGIVILCCAPVAVVVLLIAAVTFIGGSAKQTVTTASSSKASAKDATATTIAGGWINYSDPNGKFSAQLPSQPKASQASSSNGPVSVWTSTGNGGHLSSVVALSPLPAGTDPKSQDPLNNAAKSAASSSGMTIKGQFIGIENGVTHLDALMANSKNSTNVRFFISGSTLVGLSITTDDQTNDGTAFNTLTRTFKIGNGTAVHGAEVVNTTAAPATTAAASKGAIDSWISYSEPSGLFSVKMPAKPTSSNATQGGVPETTWFSATDSDAAEISLVKQPSSMSGQITASALKTSLSTVANSQGFTIDRQATSSANGSARLDATLSNSQAKVQIKMLVQGSNIYQLTYMAPKSTSDDSLNKMFTAFAASFKLGQAS